MPVIFILLLILIFLAAILIGIYNRFVVLKNKIENAWAQIDVQLKRRYDLIPNLVETVKGYAAHEKEVFEKVTQARTQAISASGVSNQAQAENMLTGALKTLFAVAEAYPELKAHQNFLMLQEELSGTESKIAYARQFYNDTVMKFNTVLNTFPSNVVGALFGFKEKDYFEIEEASREPVKVQF
ncbi:MAG: LemA family protein [Candidatus Subteraquimicrobiales bacterium]|nr:LemA family protein [Candidatus Subteraquimicrobiales bacterium]